MNAQNFNITFLVDQTPRQAFDAINNVSAWWTENMEGNSQKPGDEFSVQFGDVHYSKQKLTEVVPGRKVVWQIIDSRLTFVKDVTEWKDTTAIFEITTQDGKTQVSFTHVGLTPEIECYQGCSGGWTRYITSLKDLITTGKGQPALKVTEADATR